MQEIIKKAKDIKCLITDVDGVLTNGYLYIDNHGNELKAFHVQDGMGLKLLMAAGIHVAVITTARNNVIEERMAQLGIELYYKGQVDKREAYRQLKERLNLKDNQFAYIGDDLPDMPIIKEVGLGVAVNNAVPEVIKAACFKTEKNGGEGAVRELCDLILSAQNLSEKALERYLIS